MTLERSPTDACLPQQQRRNGGTFEIRGCTNAFQPQVDPAQVKGVETLSNISKTSTLGNVQRRSSVAYTVYICIYTYIYTYIPYICVYIFFTTVISIPDSDREQDRPG